MGKRENQEIGKGMTYSFGNYALVIKMLADPLHQLHLLLGRQTCNGRLDYTSQGYLVHRNEAVVVHIREETHDELAVHTIRNTSMPRDRITEILDLECTLEA